MPRLTSASCGGTEGSMLPTHICTISSTVGCTTGEEEEEEEEDCQ